MQLTHWGRATHICVGKLTTIGSDNGLSPGRRQAIISTIAGILLIWPLGRNFSEISIDIQTFSFKKIHFKMASAKWRPSCLGLNVLTSPNQLWPGELGRSATRWFLCYKRVHLLRAITLHRIWMVEYTYRYHDFLIDKFGEWNTSTLYVCVSPWIRCSLCHAPRSRQCEIELWLIHWLTYF